MSTRIGLAGESGILPTDGSVLLIAPPDDVDPARFGAARITVLHDMMPEAAHWQARGFQVVQDMPTQDVDSAVVFLPRSRQAARDRIARAASVAGRVFVDGQKTDGVEALLKEVRAVKPLEGSLSKAHGKLFWFETEGASFHGWLAEPGLIAGRWHVVPGVFSADGIDPGSALLADALPAYLKGRVADLGAGWGYLAGTVLDRCPGIETLHLVEAHSEALDCARRNVTDPRARFHWADATEWMAERNLDAVIMNPPFHTGRSADTGLGRAFIAAVARLLRPGGTLWMVANRHLAYEQALRSLLADVSEIGGDNRYKLMRAVAISQKRR